MVALITGGSRGIGLGIARALAAAGYDLVISGRRDASDVASALQELRTAGVRAEYVAADVASGADRQKLIDEVRRHFGKLHVLVNNAGIAPRVRADILEATPESFDELISTNLKGPYFLTQLAARWMIEQKQADASYRGVIVNVSSISAVLASVNRGDYCISKAGIAMASRLWAVRLAEFGIDVYEVRPGIVATDMTAGVKQKYDAMIERGLLLEKRWGTPEDIGKAVRLLACGELPYATGAVLTVDGGLTLERL